MGLLFPVFFSVDEGMPLGDIHPADCFSAATIYGIRFFRYREKFHFVWANDSHRLGKQI